MGLQGNEVYANVQHLFLNRKNSSWPMEIRRSFPWILWRIWKNRNLFLFEGKSFDPKETIGKIKSDVEEWFNAQSLDEFHGEELRVPSDEFRLQVSERKRKKWSKPEHLWVKCNVGVVWSEKKEILGSSWIVRNEEGEVLLHSRRSFTKVKSRDDAFLLSLTWAIESMCSHNLSKVLFEIQSRLVVSMVKKPKAWPAYLDQSKKIVDCLNRIKDKKLVCVESSENIGAFLIAKSVVAEDRICSYVASGFPLWLKFLFEREKLQ